MGSLKKGALLSIVSCGRDMAACAWLSSGESRGRKGLPAAEYEEDCAIADVHDGSGSVLNGDALSELDMSASEVVEKVGDSRDVHSAWV